MQNGSLSSITRCCSRHRLARVAFSRLALLLIAGSAFVACGEGTTEPPAPAVASVIVSPSAATLSGVGASQAFTAEALDADGNLIPSTSVTWTSQNPGIATVDESGIATVVASGQVTITADMGWTHGHALLTISVPGVPPVTSWTVEGAPYLYLWDVWGISSTDLYAVGEGGWILHYDGPEWQPAVNGTSGGSFYAVWGTSSSDVYAAGYSSRMRHYDGTGWSSIASGASWNALPKGSYSLRDVWGTSSSDIYVVGYYYYTPAHEVVDICATILHYDGIRWSAMTGGTGEFLYAIWGTSSSDVYAVGDGGTILHYDGIRWSTMTTGTTKDLKGVWGTSSNDVYAVGYDTILHYDGSEWSQMESGIFRPTLYGVWGTSSNDVYAVGAVGTILHYDGSEWSQMESGTGTRLTGVWGTSSTDVYVVGFDGIFLRGTR